MATASMASRTATTATPISPPSCNTYDAVACYANSDGDGFGSVLILGLDGSCAVGFVPQAGDCSDTDADRYPGAPELCDRVDQDCDGLAQGGVATARLRDDTSLPLVDGATVSALDVARIDLCGGAWDLQVQLDGTAEDIVISAHPDFARPLLGGARALVEGEAGRRAEVTLSGVDLQHSDLGLTVISLGSTDAFARAQLTLDDVNAVGVAVSALVDTIDVDVAILDATVASATFDRAAVVTTGGTLVVDGATFADNAWVHDPGDDDALLVGVDAIVDLTDTRFLRTQGRPGAFWGTVLATTGTTWEDGSYDPGTTVGADGGALFQSDGLWDDVGSAFRRNGTPGRGGAVFAEDTDVELDGTVVAANGPDPAGTATAEVGGALWVDGDLFAYGAAIFDSTAALSSAAIHHSGGMLWLEDTDVLDSTLLPGNAGPVALHTSGTWAVIQETSRIAGFVAEESTCVELHHRDNGFLHGMEFTDCQALCLSMQNGGVNFLTGNTFEGCTGDGGHGGALRASGGYLTIGRNDFRNNHADGDGGAVWADVADLNIDNRHPTLSSWSPTGYGYGVDYYGTETALFEGNDAGGHGGALYSVGRIDLCDATFRNNHADGDGGAVAAATSLTVYDEYGCDQPTRVEGNTATLRGGGLFVAGAMDLTHIDIVGNSALAGGGAWVEGYVDGGVTASVTDNVATTTGGGIHTFVTSNSDFPSGVLFARNQAQVGGALYVEGYGFYQLFPPVLFTSTSFTDNVASEGSAFYMDDMYGLWVFGPYSYELSDTFTGSVVLDRNLGATAIVRAGGEGDWVLEVDAITPQVFDDQGATCALPVGTSQVTCAPGAACVCP